MSLNAFSLPPPLSLSARLSPRHVAWFIGLASELYKLRNFTGLLNIVAALIGHVVTKLVESQSAVGAEAQQQLKVRR
jgi:hypothetical protein